MADRDVSYYVFAVSDGTGDTAERTIRAALTQFETEADVRRFGQLRDVVHLHDIIAQAAGQRALIVHTLVTPELRQVMFDECRRHNIPTLDLMGPLLDRLSDLMQARPLAQPGLYGIYQPEEYGRRIEAMDFAFRHDDGRHVDELEKAEIVLTGVSRTGKTPLSVYLAYRGWLVGNVPIVPLIEPPAILARLPAERVIGLTVEPGRLARLRQSRAVRLGSPLRSYTNPTDVRDEIQFAQALCQRHGWRTVDMTSKPIEEATAEVITLMGKTYSDQ